MTVPDAGPRNPAAAGADAVVGPPADPDAVAGPPPVRDVAAAPPPLPPLEPGSYHELRVHGVAGTSPESMLGLQARLTGADAAPTDDGCGPATHPGDISVWTSPRVRPSLRAWSWSSLTSGHWYQAFYLILLPFMIANVAGWMVVSDRCAPAEEAPGDDARRAPGDDPPPWRTGVLRSSTLLVRLVGLLVTAVFVLSIQLVLADLVAWQWLYHRILKEHWIVGAGPAATALTLAGVVGLTRIRQRAQLHGKDPWADHRDPVGIGFLHHGQQLLWNSPGINVALRRLHLAGGLATIALIAAWPGAPLAAPWSAMRATAFGVAIASAVLVVGFLAAISLGDSRTALGPLMALIRAVLWLLPTAAVALAALAPLGMTTDADAAPPTLPALRGAALWVTVAVLAGVLALFVVGVRARRTRRAVNAPAMLLLGASIGAAFGAGLAAQVARWIDGTCGGTCLVIGQQVHWLAVGVTTSLAVLLVVTGVRVIVIVGSGNGSRLAARLTEKGTWITAVLGGVGTVLAAVGVAVAVFRPGGLPDTTAFPAALAAAVVAGVVGPPVVLVLVLAVRAAWAVPASDGSGVHRGPRRRAVLRTVRVLGVLAAAAAVTSGVGLALRYHATVSAFGVALPPPDFTEFATDVALVLPTAAALARIYGGVTSRATRRGVGVLWDVGTFWPRWFHPFAPPAYSDRAVTQLAAQLETDLDGAGHSMLLAPHSQGAVIAATAVLLGRPQPRLAMLSYGSPWDRLYAEFFPSQVNGATTAAVANRLSGCGLVRWINLYRETDPIGGRVPGVPLGVGLADQCRRMHSDYWAEGAYRSAAGLLRAMLPLPRPAAAPADPGPLAPADPAGEPG